MHQQAINNQSNWLLRTLLTCKQFTCYKIGHDVATHMKRVLKTYANSKALASMRLMRSLSKPLQLEQQRKLRER